MWFDMVYRTHYQMLLKTAVALLTVSGYDTDQAEALVQDTFFTLWETINAGTAVYYPRTWLVDTLRNKIGTEFQHKRYQSEIPLAPEHEQIAASGDGLDKLEYALPAGLSDGERRLLHMYYEEGLSHEAIAARLGCTPHASEARLARLKKKCRKLSEK